MFSKGSKLYSIFTFTCPQCQEGKFFKAHPYNLKEVGNLHEHCSVCGLKYEKEVGFYYGAMYVSYGLAVGVFIALWLSFYLFFPDLSTATQIWIVVSVSVATGPLLYALSKIIWANLFFSYKGK